MSTRCAAAIPWVCGAVLLARMLADVPHADRCRAGETQACADAAAERIQTLETTMEEQAAAAEAAASEAREALASLQEHAAAGLHKAEADMAAALEAAAADKEAAVGALQAQLQQLQVGVCRRTCPTGSNRGWGANSATAHKKVLVASHIIACHTGHRCFLTLLSRTQHPKLPALLILSASSAQQHRCNAGVL